MIKSKRLGELVRISMFAALISVAAWIQIPFSIPITLQTAAILVTLMILPRFDGLICVLIYVLIGAVGLPVFSGFTGGIGHILGIGGGYIIGFLFMSATYTILRAIFGDGKKKRLLFGIASLAVMYAVAILWICFVYTDPSISGFWALMIGYVLPFIIPDGIKLFLAYALSNKFKEKKTNG